MEINHRASESTTGAGAAPGSLGLLRGLVIGWTRLADRIALMDHGPYDHVSDRLRALEQRVASSEEGRQRSGEP